MEKVDEQDLLTFKTVQLNGFSLFCNWENVD